MYLFKVSPRKFVFGDTSTCECPAGMFRPLPSNDLTRIAFIHNATNSVVHFETEVASILKADGTPYASIAEILIALDGFFAAPNLIATNALTKLIGSLTRPADVLDYAANDRIANATAKVKQVSTITLTGAGGNANITGTGGLTKLATFNTSLAQTAIDFVAAHAAAYDALAIPVTVTPVGDTVVFTAKNYDSVFVAPVITNVTETLGGTVQHTTANQVAVAQKETITLTGTAGTATITAIAPLSKTITFDNDPATTAAAFKTANEAYYAGLGITLTNSGDTIVFTAAVAGTGFTAPVFTNVTGDIAGVLANAGPDYVANVTAVAQVETIPLTGAGGTIVIAATGGLTKTVTYATSKAATAAAFVATNLALYDAQNVVVSANGDSIVFTGKVPGTGFTAPTISGVTKNLAGTIVSTSNVSIFATELTGDAAIVDGGGGDIKLVKIQAPAKYAAKTITIYVYSAQPTDYVGDNVAFVPSANNWPQLEAVIPIVMGAVVNSAAIVTGQNTGSFAYKCASDSKTLCFELVVGDAIVAPESAGEFNIAVTVNIQA